MVNKTAAAGATETPGKPGFPSISNARRFIVAPMMDWTDRLKTLSFLAHVVFYAYSC